MTSDRTSAVFREMNETIDEQLRRFDAVEPADFYCECPSSGCVRRVQVTSAEYEAVRDAGELLLSPECTTGRILGCVALG